MARKPAKSAGLGTGRRYRPTGKKRHRLNVRREELASAGVDRRYGSGPQRSESRPEGQVLGLRDHSEIGTIAASNDLPSLSRSTSDWRQMVTEEEARLVLLQ